MEYEEWFDEYKPTKNVLDPQAGFDGCLFETYPPHIDAVRKADPEKVWTLLSLDDGSQVLAAGYHYVNRLGYFITEKGCSEDLSIVVCEGDDEELDDVPQ